MLTARYALCQLGTLFTVVAAAGSLASYGCAAGETETSASEGSGGATSTTSAQGGGEIGGQGGMPGEGGMGGNNNSFCEIDCTTIETPQCLKSVCNEGQYSGPIGVCTVVPDEAGASCDDGQYCTVTDVCNDAGACTGGGQNDCGMPAAACETVVCDEASKSCSGSPADNGSVCVAEDLCMVGGTCTDGLCLGTPNDCFFAPAGDCEVAICNSANGLCEPVPNFDKDGDACNTGDFCQDNKTCSAGACGNGVPKDCSALDGECLVGGCDSATGLCNTDPLPAGSACSEATDVCNMGTCDANQVCQATPLADGTLCDDFSLCTTADQCTTGVCGGALMPSCDTYYQETFEMCPPLGWTLNAEWECGAPTSVGPSSAYQGSQLLALDLNAAYDILQSYAQAYTQTPKISLANATAPVMRYHHWVDTEGGPFDGYNVNISTDNGVTFSVLTTITPAYPLMVNGQPAYGGYNQVWQTVDVDLSAFVGQQVILRFAFQSDGSINSDGVYIDSITIAEPAALP